MRVEHFTFGSIRIDGVTCPNDVVIDHGKIRERRKNWVVWSTLAATHGC